VSHHVNPLLKTQRQGGKKRRRNYRENVHSWESSLKKKDLKFEKII
jgi:hypothetical protein